MNRGISSIAVTLGLTGGGCCTANTPVVAGDVLKPNVVFIFADQWRAGAVGYAGDENVRTPNLDRLAAEGLVLTRMVANCPVSAAYRTSLLTGTWPLTNGIFYNDKPLNDHTSLTLIGDAFRDAGYSTAYVGKWHVDGHGRDSFIPRERRGGFEYWKARECTHNYNRSFYYADSPEVLWWEGYDALAQTRDVLRYIEERDPGEPFALVLSWGPPHDPYDTAPKQYRDIYRDGSAISLRGNVPEADEPAARRMLAGYYAHIAALDECVGMIEQCLKAEGLWENTIFVFTSDHGDMLLSHGETKKQKPWDESILVPFVMHYPGMREATTLDIPVDTPDLMPTLLGMSGVKIPTTVEGRDLSGWFRGGKAPADTVSLIASYVPFHEWNYARGGREYRGIRTPRYTYVRDMEGPWLLHDNAADPLQMDNLVGKPEAKKLERRLDKALQIELKKQKDAFLSGPEYMKMWNYSFDPQDPPGPSNKITGLDGKPIHHKGLVSLY